MSKNGGECLQMVKCESTVMIVQFGPTTSRMGVNVAQAEELILEN